MFNFKHTKSTSCVLHILFLTMCKGRLETLQSLLSSDKDLAAGFLRKAPLFCPVCLLYTACSRAVLIFVFGDKVHTYTPHYEKRGTEGL